MIGPDLRSAIRTQALSLFAQRGVDAVSVAEICREAEVANGSFYNFYRSKDALIADLLAEAAQVLAAALARAQASNGDAAADHRRDVTIIVDFVEANWRLFLLLLTTHARPGMEGSPVEAFVRQRTAEIRRGVAAGRFRRDLIPEIVAPVEVGLITETLRWWVQNQDALPKATLIDQLTAIRVRITNGGDPA
jgi:AcrR family transcriptional regulator